MRSNFHTAILDIIEARPTSDGNVDMVPSSLSIQGDGTVDVVENDTDICPHILAGHQDKLDGCWCYGRVRAFRATICCLLSPHVAYRGVRTWEISSKPRTIDQDDPGNQKRGFQMDTLRRLTASRARALIPRIVPSAQPSKIPTALIRCPSHCEFKATKSSGVAIRMYAIAF